MLNRKKTKLNHNIYKIVNRKPHINKNSQYNYKTLNGNKKKTSCISTNAIYLIKKSFVTYKALTKDVDFENQHDSDTNPSIVHSSSIFDSIFKSTPKSLISLKSHLFSPPKTQIPPKLRPPLIMDRSFINENISSSITDDVCTDYKHVIASAGSNNDNNYHNARSEMQSYITALIYSPQQIEQVHRNHLQLGANILTTSNVMISLSELANFDKYNNYRSSYDGVSLTASSSLSSLPSTSIIPPSSSSSSSSLSSLSSSSSPSPSSSSQLQSSSPALSSLYTYVSTTHQIAASQFPELDANTGHAWIFGSDYSLLGLSQSYKNWKKNEEQFSNVFKSYLLQHFSFLDQNIFDKLRFIHYTPSELYIIQRILQLIWSHQFENNTNHNDTNDRHRHDMPPFPVHPDTCLPPLFRYFEFVQFSAVLAEIAAIEHSYEYLIPFYNKDTNNLSFQDAYLNYAKRVFIAGGVTSLFPEQYIRGLYNDIDYAAATTTTNNNNNDNNNTTHDKTSELLRALWALNSYGNDKLFPSVYNNNKIINDILLKYPYPSTEISVQPQQTLKNAAMSKKVQDKNNKLLFQKISTYIALLQRIQALPSPQLSPDYLFAPIDLTNDKTNNNNTAAKLNNNNINNNTVRPSLCQSLHLELLNNTVSLLAPHVDMYVGQSCQDIHTLEKLVLSIMQDTQTAKQEAIIQQKQRSVLCQNLMQNNFIPVKNSIFSTNLTHTQPSPTKLKFTPYICSFLDNNKIGNEKHILKNIEKMNNYNIEDNHNINDHFNDITSINTINSYIDNNNYNNNNLTKNLYKQFSCTLPVSSSSSTTTTTSGYTFSNIHEPETSLNPTQIKQNEDTCHFEYLQNVCNNPFYESTLESCVYYPTIPPKPVLVSLSLSADDYGVSRMDSCENLMQAVDKLLLISPRFLDGYLLTSNTCSSITAALPFFSQLTTKLVGAYIQLPSHQQQLLPPSSSSSLLSQSLSPSSPSLLPPSRPSLLSCFNYGYIPQKVKGTRLTPQEAFINQQIKTLHLSQPNKAKMRISNSNKNDIYYTENTFNIRDAPYLNTEQKRIAVKLINELHDHIYQHEETLYHEQNKHTVQYNENEMTSITKNDRNLGKKYAQLATFWAKELNAQIIGVSGVEKQYILEMRKNIDKKYNHS